MNSWAKEKIIDIILFDSFSTPLNLAKYKLNLIIKAIRVLVAYKQPKVDRNEYLIEKKNEMKK